MENYPELITFPHFFSIQSSTIRPTEEERAQTIEKLMKDEKEKAITQFYPDYDYEDEEEEEEKIRIIKPDIANRFRPNRPKFTVNFTNYF